MASLKTKSCHCCSGSGKELDHKAVGASMAAFRKSHRKSQAQVARLMGFTPPFLCHLESGARSWRPDLIEQYKRACEV